MNLEQLSRSWLACAEHARSQGEPVAIVDEYKHKARLARLVAVEQLERERRRNNRRPAD